MECRAGRALHAMWRPRAAPVFETDMAGRMSIPRCVNGNALAPRFFNPFIENRHDLIAFTDGERTAGTKIILHIDNQQRIAVLHAFNSTL